MGGRSNSENNAFELARRAIDKAKAMSEPRERLAVLASVLGSGNIVGATDLHTGMSIAELVLSTPEVGNDSYVRVALLKALHDNPILLGDLFERGMLASSDVTFALLYKRAGSGDAKQQLWALEKLRRRMRSGKVGTITPLHDFEITSRLLETSTDKDLWLRVVSDPLFINISIPEMGSGGGSTPFAIRAMEIAKRALPAQAYGAVYTALKAAQSRRA